MSDLAIIEQHQVDVQTRIQDLNIQYSAVALAAGNDRTPETDLKAALLAPSIFLANFDDFERTSSIIIHHLEQALQKSSNAWDQARVRRIAQETFNALIYVLERKLATMQENNLRGLLDKLKSWLPSFLGVVGERAVNTVPVLLQCLLTEDYDIEAILDAASQGDSALFASFAAQTSSLLCATVDFMIRRWKIRKQQQEVALQIGNMLIRLLKTDLYTEEYSLLSSTFQRVKFYVLPAMLTGSTVQFAVWLMAYDHYEDERQQSAALMVSILCDRGAWAALMTLMSYDEIQTVDNYALLRKAAINAHKAATEPSIHNEFILPLMALFAPFFCYAVSLSTVESLVLALVVANLFITLPPYLSAWRKRASFRNALPHPPRDKHKRAFAGERHHASAH